MAKKEETEVQETSSKSNRVADFYQETKEELDKVVWPSRQQLFSESAGVLLMIFLSASLIYLIDNFFHWASGQVFG